MKVHVIVDCAFNEEVCELAGDDIAQNGPFYLARDADEVIAALHAEVERRERLLEQQRVNWTDIVRAAEARVLELTRERDEARDIARKVPGLEFELKAKTCECELADAEVTRLTEALAAAKRDLQAEQLSHDRTSKQANERRESAEARVRELKESMTYRTSLVGRLESECAALRAEVADKAETIRAQNIAYDRLESRLAAANALLTIWVHGWARGRVGRGQLIRDTRDHLAAQPATAPTRTEAEQHTCDWFGRFTCRVCGKRRSDES